MTREESVKYIKSKMCNDCSIYLGGGKCSDNCKVIEAIKALEQEPCGDAISRQAVLDLINENIRIDDDKLELIAYFVENMPPVTPQPKTGHWKKMVEVYDLQQNRMLVPYGYDDAKFGNTPVYVCDCGCESTKNSRFCPDCGTKMVEPQESEVQA